MLNCLFIALKTLLFSMSSNRDPVIRIFDCIFIDLKISLFSMSSSHDQLIKLEVPFSFHCFENFTVLHVIHS